MKDIPGFESLYGVTRNGRVYSYKRKIYLKLDRDKGGYKIFRIKTNGKQRRYGVAKLVYELYIEKLSVGDEVDHRNHNRLDNRVSNLRKATRSENMANTRKRAHSLSRFKGVSWHKSRGKWQSKIRCNYRWYHLGYFINEEAAAIAYDLAANQLFGEHALTNFL